MDTPARVIMNILAFAAHTDGVEIGCGGLLLKAARSGHSVHICTMSDGAASGDPAQRTKELNLSAKFIGSKDVTATSDITIRLELFGVDN